MNPKKISRIELLNRFKREINSQIKIREEELAEEGENLVSDLLELQRWKILNEEITELRDKLKY